VISAALPMENMAPGRTIIFSPRYFNPVYGIELQLAAIEQMDQELLDRLHFIFIKGIQMGNSYADNLEKKLHTLQNKRNLSYDLLYEIDQSKMFRLFKSSSLTLLTPASDGTPNTALEAMAAKCPLIVPDLPYDEELFNTMTCHTLRQKEPAKLIELIRYVLENDVSAITDHAYDTVLKFGNREVEMAKLAKLYEKLN
jgi:glycosyltransferase involved in cell wall biosynthesis